MAEIEHVSDTALWVATYRAMESERPDAIFRDPLAKVLSGDRGRAIARRMPYRRLMQWIMVARTSAIDRLVLDAVSLGVDTVLNLGAGLDTRPYRMKLPASLHWIEADFPHMIELKNTKLAAESPVCRLERVAIDLSDVAARRAFLERVSAQSKSGILAITEGVIAYLSNDAAASLARDLHATPNCRFWIQDVYSGDSRRHTPPSWKNRLRAAAFLFDADAVEFFGRIGWKRRSYVTAFEEARRLGRPMPFVFPWSLLLPFMSKERRRRMLAMWGYVLFER